MTPTGPLAWRLARRELRGGLKGFRIFLACLTLGVAIIAAVGSIAAAVKAGLARDAQALLGGDVEFRLIYRPANPDERAVLTDAGTLSEARELRAMARPSSGEPRVLVELKAVDSAYPLYGSVRLSPAMPLGDVLALRNGAWGAAAERDLVDRLALELGGRIRVGVLDYQLRAIIEAEPDRGAEMFTLGPRLLVGLGSLEATGLLQPGSLTYQLYRLKLPPGVDAAAVIASVNKTLPKAGWRTRGLDDAAAGAKRFIDRLGQFLGLLGLGALLVGGVGVGNAVRFYLEGKQSTIATLKCLGAPSPLIFRTYLILIGLLALGGTAAGIILGALSPLAAAGLLAGRFPVILAFALYPTPLLTAAGFGLLTALGFSLWPLQRTREIPAALLFRGHQLSGMADRWAKGIGAVRGDRTTARFRRRIGLDAAATAVTGLALAGLVILTASDRRLALEFVIGAAVAFLVFRLAAWAIVAAARRLNRPGGGPSDPARRRSAPLRLALANLHRPGAPTGSIMPSLGLGLTVLVAVASIQGNLEHELAETLPATAPSFFFIDIQADQAAAFDALVRSEPGVSDLQRVPMLRGRITAVAGVPVARMTPPPELAWVLQGDRGVTWSATPPTGGRLVAGAWWPADYRGPPLISLDAEVAVGLGLKLGDTLTVNVLGHDITGTIANLRDVDWTTLGINFVMVFSPGLLEEAPQTHIATVHADLAEESRLLRAVTDRFANITAIRVREALESARRILAAVGVALGAAGSVTLLAGILVLAGAVIAGHHRRVYDAVVLKVLGATRRDLARVFFLEFGLLGLMAAGLAAALGSGAAYFFVTHALESDWEFLPGTVAGIALLGIAVTLFIGFAGTWQALGQKAAPLLRNE